MRVLSSTELNSVAGGWNNFENPVQDVQFDPSPNDGVFGLEVFLLPDGGYQYTTETEGYWDVLNKGEQDDGEGPVGAGESGILYPSDNPLALSPQDVLNSWTPTSPPIGVPGV